MTAAEWIACEIIGNEIKGFDSPLPLESKGEIARALVMVPCLGWPDIEAAQGTLDEWNWA